MTIAVDLGCEATKQTNNPNKQTGNFSCQFCRLYQGWIPIRLGVDPGFLERGFLCIKVWGVCLPISLIFLKYPMKMEYFGLTETKLFHFHGISETKLFHFHGIFKNRWHGGGFKLTP